MRFLGELLCCGSTGTWLIVTQLVDSHQLCEALFIQNCDLPFFHGDQPSLPKLSECEAYSLTGCPNQIGEFLMCHLCLDGVVVGVFGAEGTCEAEEKMCQTCWGIPKDEIFNAAFDLLQPKTNELGKFEAALGLAFQKPFEVFSANQAYMSVV